MLCTIKQFEKREDENRELPFYVIRATGSRGDIDAKSAFNDDGTINVMAMQSRVFNFTKTMFPATKELCESLESGMPVDDDGNLTEERKINLMLYQWDTGKKFNIVNKDGEFYGDMQTVEKVADKQMTKNGKVLKLGDKYMEEEFVARVYTQVSLVLFCDANENCVEGNAEELAERSFKRGIENGTYILVDQNIQRLL